MSQRGPFGAHEASPAELQAQIAAERRGEPYLLFRDGEGVQQILTLGADTDRATVGRAPDVEVCLAWDAEVSRTHAQFVRLGREWTIADDGLSRNGTTVNGERLRGQHRLRDGDVVGCGVTVLVFRAPPLTMAETAPPSSRPNPVTLSEAQRRVLFALCAPFATGDRFARAPTNQQLADQLFLSVETVKTHLRALFERFGVEDLPHNQKRARLVELALETGTVSRYDLLKHQAQE